MRISSSGPAAELYPDSLGDYYLLPYPDTSHNDLPVYKHSVRDDRFVVNMIIDIGNVSEHFMLITREISNSGLREFSSVRKDGQMIEDLDWQYNRYPNCRTRTWAFLRFLYLTRDFNLKHTFFKKNKPFLFRIEWVYQRYYITLEQIEEMEGNKTCAFPFLNTDTSPPSLSNKCVVRWY